MMVESDSIERGSGERLENYSCRMIKAAMLERGIRNKDLARLICNDLGINENAAYHQVYSTVSYPSMIFPGEGTNEFAAYRQLSRLSIIVYALGFSPDSELVSEIKDGFPDFEYPPANHSREPVPEREGQLQELGGLNQRLNSKDLEWVYRSAKNLVRSYGPVGGGE